MKDKYIKLKMEMVVNKILYNKKIINKDIFEKTSKELEKLLFIEKQKEHLI